MKPSEPSRNESNFFFDEDTRRRLEEICSELSFLEQIKEIAVRYKPEIRAIVERKSFKERMRLLNTIEKATKKVLKALDIGLGDDPHFISQNAAKGRLRALGHVPKDLVAMMRKVRTERRRGKKFVSARDLGIPSFLRCDAWDALGGRGPNLNRLRSDLTALLEGIASARAAGPLLRVPDEKSPVALTDDPATDDQAKRKFHAPRLVTQVQWLMVGELADVFKKHKLELSRTEGCPFLLCVEVVREACGFALDDTRSFLRSLPASIFCNEEDSSPVAE